jgi:DNA repair exonuclease SbcCD ATPase subunit
MKLIAVVPVLSLLALPAVAQESMAQAAERQKKARTGQTKVITDAELRNNRSKAYNPASVDGAAPAASAETGAPTPAAPGASAAPKSPDQLRAEKKAELEGKIKQWDDFIAETTKAMEGAQAELNDLRDATLGNRRAGLQRVLDEGNQHIAEAQQTIADLREQARRSGVALSR